MNIHSIILCIVTLNGIYDILCATSILKITHLPPLDTLHLSMFHKKPNLFFLVFYLFFNGMIRIFGIYFKQFLIVSFSYFIEAGYILYETIQTNTVQYKAYFVVITSLFLGIIIILYSQNQHFVTFPYV